MSSFLNQKATVKSYHPCPVPVAISRHAVNRIGALVVAADPPVKRLVIDAQAIHDMDVTAAQRFEELDRELAENGIELKIADAPRPLLAGLARVGLSEEMGRRDFFVSVKKATEAFRQQFPSPTLPSGPIGPGT